MAPKGWRSMIGLPEPEEETESAVPPGYAQLPARTVEQSGGSSTRLTNKADVLDALDQSAAYSTQAAKGQVDLEAQKAAIKADELEAQAANLRGQAAEYKGGDGSEAMARADEHLSSSNALFEQATKEIDPDRFFRDRGAASKVAIAIGMALSSVAEGMSGGKVQNASRKIIDDAINRDVAVQRVAAEAAMRRGEHEKSVYGMLRAKGMDERQASQASRGLLMQALAMSAQADAQRLMAGDPAKAARLQQLAASFLADAEAKKASVLGRESSTYTSGKTTTPGELVQLPGATPSKEQAKAMREAHAEYEDTTGTTDLVKRTLRLAQESYKGSGDPLDTQITWDGEKLIGVLPFGGEAVAQLNATLPMLLRTAKALQGDVGAMSKDERPLFEAMFKARGFKTTPRDLLAALSRFDYAAFKKRKAVFKGQLHGTSPDVIRDAIEGEPTRQGEYERLFRGMAGTKAPAREPSAEERRYMERLRVGRAHGEAP